jgi:hypothetical protein
LVASRDLAWLTFHDYFAEIDACHFAPLSTRLESNSDNTGISQCGTGIRFRHLLMTLLEYQASISANPDDLLRKAPEYSLSGEKYFPQGLTVLGNNSFSATVLQVWRTARCRHCPSGLHMPINSNWRQP